MFLSHGEIVEPPARPRRAAVVDALEARQLLTGLTIVPTFAANILSDPNAGKIEAAINAGITQIEANFSTPITVPIEFQEGGGLGTSDTAYGIITYSQWRAALAAKAIDANQLSAIANVPNTATSPDNGSGTVDINLANELALGITPGSTPQFFSTITLNTSICNLTRTSINADKYDLQAVAMHEMDEVLGIGSSLDENTVNNGPLPTDDIEPEDLFRYSAGPNGTLDYSTNSSASVYFSIDGGKTDLAQFNQDASGDYNDWYSINGGVIPQVQDAFATPGVVSNYDVEPVVLDVLGYTPTRTLGTGIISGVVFDDANGDGVQDAGEANLSGWTVEAIQNGAVVTTAQSNALGYQLGSLADGTYTIEEVPQAGYSQTTPSAPFTVTITGHNDTVTGQNFGEEPVTVPAPTVVSVTPEDNAGNGIAAGSAAKGQRSMETQIAVVFSEPVNLVGGAFSLGLVNNYGSGANNGSADTSLTGVLGTPANPSGDGETWIIPVLSNGTNSDALKGTHGGISGASLDNGVYQLNVVAADVTAATGGTAMAANYTSAAWHRLYGDVDNARRVFNTEYSSFLAAFSSTYESNGATNYNQDLDEDGDGRVFNTDYSAFLADFGSTKIYTEPES